VGGGGPGPGDPGRRERERSARRLGAEAAKVTVPPARLLMYAATAGGFALAIKSIVDEPPPLWLALTALIGYLALITLGVTFSRFSMFADVVTRGPSDARG